LPYLRVKAKANVLNDEIRSVIDFDYDYHKSMSMTPTRKKVLDTQEYSSQVDIGEVNDLIYDFENNYDKDDIKDNNKATDN